jgi:hypothetical protein
MDERIEQEKIEEEKIENDEIKIQNEISKFNLMLTVELNYYENIIKNFKIIYFRNNELKIKIENTIGKNKKKN